ncbi:YadA family autotransporter adhesin [Oligella urethralis]|uniref:YadA family autotransporter adhesin n=1 Tax=Oligella urethralis TaxID=90245 RepID=UPI000E00EBA1|nr:YadA-like family protein [Oligella urethralis]SUA55664.1 YadA-like C-terminal region [Oligella urethralis]
MERASEYPPYVTVSQVAKSKAKRPGSSSRSTLTSVALVVMSGLPMTASADYRVDGAASISSPTGITCTSPDGKKSYSCQIPNGAGGFATISGITAADIAAAIQNAETWATSKLGQNAIALGGTTTNAGGVNSIAVGHSTIASAPRSIAVGYNTKAEEEGVAIGTGRNTGLSATQAGKRGVAIGYEAKANGESNIAIGNTASMWYQGNNKNAIAIGTKAQVGDGVEGSIAIGNESYAGHEAINIGTPTKPANHSNQKGASRRGSTLIGAQSNTHALYSTVIGSNNDLLINQHAKTGGFFGRRDWAAQGAFSQITGSYNTVGNMDKTTNTKKYNSIAVIVSGAANEVQESNGVIISGYGNKVENSYNDQIDVGMFEPTAASSIGDKLRDSKTQLGQVGVIGAGNTVDNGKNLFLTGMHSSVKNTELSSVQGFGNKVENTKRVFVAGAKNVLDDVQNSFVTGNEQELTTVSDSILMGNNITLDNISEAVSIGNNSVVANKATAVGVGAKAEIEGSVALGIASVANTDKSITGWDQSTQTPYAGNDKATNIAWTSTAAAVSVGDVANNITRQITGVAAGLNDTDAVNVAQLKQLKASVDSGGSSPNIDEFAKSVAAGMGGESKFEGGKLITQLNVDGNTYNSVNAALNALDTKIGNAGNNTSAPWSVTDANGNTSKIGSNGKVTFVGDSNISVAQTGTDNSGKIEISLKQDVTLNSLTASTVNADSISVNNGGPVINKDGINMNNNRITNVAPGVAGTDAVNVEQLSAANHKLQQQIDANRDDIQRNNNRANAGIAAAMAAAGLPQAYLPGKSMVAIAGGVWRGESGMAIGVSTVSANGKWVLKGSANTSARGGAGGTIGAGYQW